jgi:hypothetical protein
MKVLQVVEQQMLADKNKAMFEINRILNDPNPPENVTEKLVNSVEKYSAAALSLEIIQKLIEAHKEKAPEKEKDSED